MSTEVTSAALDLTTRSRRALEDAGSMLERIERVDGADRASVLEPYDEAWLRVETVGAECGLMKEVHPDPDVRRSAEDLLIEVTRVMTRMQQSRPLYDALGRVDTSDPDELRLIDVVRRTMRRAGVELDDSAKSQVTTLREENTRLGQEFLRNIRDDVRAIEISPDRLAGMPDDFVRQHPAGPNGRVRVTTDYPDYIPFLAYADDATARKDLFLAFANRAAPRNVEVLEEMIRTKHQQARLLGYPTWADLQAEESMMGSAAGIRRFIEEVAEIARDRTKREMAQMLALKRRSDPTASTVYEWELSYLQEKVRAAETGFDAREVRPYLEYGRVRQAILDLNSELFGLEFERASDPSWHPSIETFDVSVDGEPGGRISLDMHPRPNKYKHAANFGYRPGAAGKQATHSVLVCNFPDPSAAAGPALMEHREVVTYFHEFGHLVHSIMRGRVGWGRLARPTEFDFIEAPSQFLEQWIFDRDVLRRFALHVETGEPIPERTVELLRAARDLGRGVQTQRQAFLSMVSLEYHDRDPRDLDTTAIWRDVAERWSPTTIEPEAIYQSSWTHLPGYAALYSTYTRSKTVAEDLSLGFGPDLMNVRQARRYRDIVLGQGGMKPALGLVEEFLGRPHDLAAYRRWLG